MNGLYQNLFWEIAKYLVIAGVLGIVIKVGSNKLVSYCQKIRKERVK
jgi:hypothetical protein